MPDVTTQAPEPSLTALPDPSVRLGVTLASAALAASAIAQPSVSFPNEEIFIFGTPKRIWMVFCCFFSEAHAQNCSAAAYTKGVTVHNQKWAFRNSLPRRGCVFATDLRLSTGRKSARREGWKAVPRCD